MARTGSSRRASLVVSVTCSPAPAPPSGEAEDNNSGSLVPPFKRRSFFEAHSESRRKKLKNIKQVMELCNATYGNDECYRRYNCTMKSHHQ